MSAPACGELTPARGCTPILGFFGNGAQVRGTCCRTSAAGACPCPGPQFPPSHPTFRDEVAMSEMGAAAPCLTPPLPALHCSRRAQGRAWEHGAGRGGRPRPTSRVRCQQRVDRGRRRGCDRRKHRGVETTAAGTSPQKGQRGDELPHAPPDHTHTQSPREAASLSSWGCPWLTPCCPCPCPVAGLREYRRRQRGLRALLVTMVLTAFPKGSATCSKTSR